MANPEFTGRGPYQGVRQIFQYNWPPFVTAAAISVIALFSLLFVSMPSVLALLVALVGIFAFTGLVCALAVSHWVYDRSELYRFTWIGRCFSKAPERWVNIHSGLDETSEAIRHLFPATESSVVDIYDPDEMTENSIKRARELTPNHVEAISSPASKLPFENAELDAAFVILAAHELRQAELREQFFRELKRVLKPGGRLILVEHLRDLPNFLAFGPGFFHFLPRLEWLRLIELSSLRLAQEFAITPFIRVFVVDA